MISVLCHCVKGAGSHTFPRPLAVPLAPYQSDLELQLQLQLQAQVQAQ